MDDFAVIYRSFSQGLYKYLYYQTGSQQLAEELLQETFFQAFKSLHRFRGDSQISTWLYGIARNVLQREWSKNKQREPNQTENYQLAVDTIVIEKENQEELTKALRELSSPYREIVILRAFNELSFREIGEVLGGDENWARVSFYRAKLKLKSALTREVCE